MNRLVFRSILLLAIAMIFTGCSTSHTSQVKRDQLHNEALTAIATFKKEDPTMQTFFDDAKGYAIFPSVGKGGVGLGGAYGKGELYKDEAMVGYCSLSQATIGFQLGGQVYSEVIFFQTDEALERFKTGNFAFSAQVSAVAVTAGASADADYDKGVAVFTMEKGGLMYEASVGGQKFSYEPK